MESELGLGIRKVPNKNYCNNFNNALGKSFYVLSEPDSIRSAFRPLGLCAKFFGLFPCYDLSFVEKLETNKIRLIHVLDYLYTIFMCLSMTGGALFCTIKPPKIMKSLKATSEDETDYYVQIVVFYMSIANGLMAMFIFPKSWCEILNYIDHFGHVDKILSFNKRLEEKKFGILLCVCVAVITTATVIFYTFIYILDLPEDGACISDYIIVPVTTLASVILLLPTTILIFFINSIRIRLAQLNKKMENYLLPYSPCCYACNSYEDYGSELDIPTLYKKSYDLVLDLEKLRLLHQEISVVTAETSNIFGGHLIRDFLHSILGIVLYSYVLLFANDNSLSYRSFYIGLDIFVIWKLLTIATFCNYIITENEASRKILNKASVVRLSPECNTQIQAFLKKLDTPIQITAAGFFVISRQLITSILGAITTYFIILIQFKVGERKVVHSNPNCSTTMTPTELDPGFNNDTSDFIQMQIF